MPFYLELLCFETFNPMRMTRFDLFCFTRKIYLGLGDPRSSGDSECALVAGGGSETSRCVSREIGTKDALCFRHRLEILCSGSRCCKACMTAGVSQNTKRYARYSSNDLEDANIF